MNDPRKLKSQLLSEAGTEQQKEFAKMLAEQCAEAELRAKGHRCWFFVPTPVEYAIMEKYVKDDKCPKCGKGRVVCEIFKDSMGETFWLKCYWGDPNCGFKEAAFDKDRV